MCKSFLSTTEIFGEAIFREMKKKRGQSTESNTLALFKAARAQVVLWVPLDCIAVCSFCKLMTVKLFFIKPYSTESPMFYSEKLQALGFKNTITIASLRSQVACTVDMLPSSPKIFFFLLPVINWGIISINVDKLSGPM